MSSTIRTPTLLAALALSLASTAAVSAPESVKPEKAATCAACHGEAGISANGMYPTLAGQYANYLEHSLKDYRSGARKNAIMAAQAANLTDAEIKELSRWYAAQQSPLYTPSVHGPLKP